MSESILLANLTANGSSTPRLVPRDAIIYCDGTFDGATVTVEYGPSSTGPWYTSDDITFTAKGHKGSTLTGRSYMRATVSSAGASTDVSVWAG